MVTILGSLIGFLGSAFPEILKVFKDKSDRRHELEILDRQMDFMKAQGQVRLQEIQSQTDAREISGLYRYARTSKNKWVDALAGSVRPVITYAFFCLYACVKLAQWHLVSLSGDWAQALIQIWHIEDQALFATVISFWFGQRMLAKARLPWMNR
ncbi:MAG: hypothetical protein ACPGXY_02085 [Alphaproteobacteria bacterium]